MLTFLDRERSVAPHGFNRWLIPPAALAVHLSIGQVYAFSVFNNPLAERFGTQQTPIAIIFSISIVMLGLSAAFGGKWVERNGPRKAMFVSGMCWVSGFLVSAVGVATGQLWLVYLGYGLIGGIGLGIGYISPVSTLIKWFPDRPGLATGMAIMGFGGGALIASPLSDALMNVLGASPSEAIVPTFLVLAGAYLVAMMLGAATVRVPPPGWTPKGAPADAQKPKEDPASEGVAVEDAFRTRQFWLCWIVLFCNVTAGIGILQQAAPMIQDYFPAVTAAAAAGFVGVLSLCNMGGRFIWSSTSDIIGRKPTYIMYLGVGAVLYLLVLMFGTSSVVLFVALTGIILTFYGGGFATVPAYLKDLFGSRNVGAIHGRLLTAWSAAGIAGPLIVSAIADHQKDAGHDGADVYTLSLQVMVGVMVVGFIANMLIYPLAERAKNARADDKLVTEKV